MFLSFLGGQEFLLTIINAQTCFSSPERNSLKNIKNLMKRFIANKERIIWFKISFMIGNNQKVVCLKFVQLQAAGYPKTAVSNSFTRKFSADSYSHWSIPSTIMGILKIGHNQTFRRCILHAKSIWHQRHIYLEKF